MRIGAIVQARTSSTRLPGKILMELPYGGGVTALQQVIRRLKKSKRLGDIIVATTTDEIDEKIAGLAEKEDVKWFRGSPDDVLSRYYLAAEENGLDIIVRITSDCPCTDPGIVDWVLEEHLTAKADYTSNGLRRTFPVGIDVEILNFEALKKAHFEAVEAFEREHVSPYIYKSKPHMFKICGVQAPEKFYGPDIRITLDTKEDYTLLCAVFDCLYPADKFFGIEDIMKLFRDKPWLGDINKNVIQKKIFDSVEQEIEEAVGILDLQGLKRAKKFLAEHLHK
ncbi:MAG: glycosyltransferase family protein [Phycisphaerae bacterium]|nr:glycosyltransferase family protein [Phycisphaerae bacterium]